MTRKPQFQNSIELLNKPQNDRKKLIKNSDELSNKPQNDRKKTNFIILSF